MTDNGLKVLLLSPLPPPAGGIASWTIQYVEWAKKNKLDVEIINTSVIGKRAEKINSDTNLWDEMKRTISILYELITKLHQGKDQIVHLNTACGKFGIIRDYLCALLVKSYNKKLVVHYRCNIEDQIIKKSVQFLFLKKLSKVADSNWVLNKMSKEYLYSNFMNSSKIIPNFINESFANGERIIVNEEIKKVVFIGHVQKTKGIYEIIEAATALPDILFQIAGPVKDEEIENSLPSNVKLYGAINKIEVKKILMNSDVFLFPTYTEGFSNALLEAMSIGLPIITTSVGANIDMLEKKGGYIIDVGDSKSIVTAIKGLNDPIRREKMSKWNLDKVRKNYTTEKVMELLVKEYKLM